MFNRVIPLKTEVKYLGIKFDNHLRFNAQVEHAKTRDQTVRGKLNSLVCRRSKLSTTNKITIYRTIVRPAMMYGVAVWGNVANTQLQKLQVVQNKFLRAAFIQRTLVRQKRSTPSGSKSSNHEEDVAGKFFEKRLITQTPSCANPSTTTKM
jgi:hypothetical protein